MIFPTLCPACQSELKLSETGVDLICTNTLDCPAQILGRLSYYCQRNVANIDGLSEKTLDKFIQKFQIHDIPDLYDLPYDEIAAMDGFGTRSIDNLRDSVERSRIIQDYKLVAGLGLEGIGLEVAKLICELIEY